MSERQGSISVNTSDIFPIIKKWLYSEHDIFIRELVANATDAITKRATLARTRNEEIPAGKIEVIVNKGAKTITVKDNGLGMTEEEVEKYIAQLAFSGAREFVEKLQKEGADQGGDIIGKFGLGFYSAFMVASKVEVETLSMNAGAKPTKWSCDGDTSYTFSDSDKSEVGTTITLHLNEESEEFLSEFKVSETLRNHCDFMPYPIMVSDKEREGKDDYSPTQVNDTVPLWKRDPSELKDEDYKKFYRHLFPTEPEPLFWLHLKVDHPFTLEGVLFFPRFNPARPFNEKTIRLYCKQVFVTDNVKNIIPEFLSLLKGAVDSHDIPLNVSRSSLQGDPNIKKISGYIVRKVAEALKKLHKNDRPKYEALWEDIGLFVKYGCVSDEKFDELMRERVLFKTNDKKLLTLPEYRANVPAEYKEKLGNTVLYFEKNKTNHSLNAQLSEHKLEAVEIDEHIDPHFIQHLEYKKVGDEEFKFSSVDAEIDNLLGSENTSADDVKVKELFTKILHPEKEKTETEKEATPSADMGDEIEIAKIKNSPYPAYFKVDEQMKRFAKMAQSMGQNASFPIKKTLVINPNNPLVQMALKMEEKGTHPELVAGLCKHVEDLALISSEGLEGDEKDAFVKRTSGLVGQLAGLALN